MIWQIDKPLPLKVNLSAKSKPDEAKRYTKRGKIKIEKVNVDSNEDDDERNKNTIKPRDNLMNKAEQDRRISEKKDFMKRVPRKAFKVSKSCRGNLRERKI